MEKLFLKIKLKITRRSVLLNFFRNLHVRRLVKDNKHYISYLSFDFLKNVNDVIFYFLQLTIAKNAKKLEFD